MKKLRNLIALALILAISVPAFTNPAEQKKSAEAQKKNNAEISFPATSLSASSYTSDIFSDFIVDIFSLLWAYDNLIITFDEYPYANGAYMNFSDPASSNIYGGYYGDYYGNYSYYDYEDDDPWVATPSGGYYGNSDPSYSRSSNASSMRTRPFRFAADASMFYQPGYGTGEAFRFEGLLWKFFGPVFEYSMNCDLPEGLNVTKGLTVTEKLSEGEYRRNLRLGAEFALFQTNFLSAYWLIQWSKLYNPKLTGNTSALLNGLIFRSYPFEPVLLEYRINVQDFSASDSSDDTNLVMESHLEIGLMLQSRWEIYGAWNFVYNDIYKFTSHGGEAGVRIHF